MDDSVLVGIVTRNRAGFLKKAIQSALDQKGANVRIAVIDDGSTDETPEVRADFSQVEWIHWGESRGYMAGRNFLMTNAGECFFASLDDDARFVRGDEIAIALAAMEANPQIGAVAFDILSPDRPGSVERTSPEPAAMFIGCGHMLRLAAAREAGLYEPSPGLYGGEEKDLCLRLMDAGYEIIRLNGVHVWHDKTAVAREQAAQHRSGVCNDLAMTLRRTPALLLPVALLAKFYRHSKFSMRHGLMRPCLQGFKLFLRSIPAVLRTRRPVRAATLRTFLQLARP